MNNITIEIAEIINILEIENTIGNISNNLQIENTSDKTVEIVTGYAGSVVYASDIIGLDNYLSNFIDAYEIDCGSP